MNISVSGAFTSSASPHKCSLISGPCTCYCIVTHFCFLENPTSLSSFHINVTSERKFLLNSIPYPNWGTTVIPSHVPRSHCCVATWPHHPSVHSMIGTVSFICEVLNQSPVQCFVDIRLSRNVSESELYSSVNSMDLIH